MASTKKQSNTRTATATASKANANAADPSEFADSKVAVGAALTYIEDLQKALPPQKYAQILDLLNKFYTHSLNEKLIYQFFKDIVKGVEGEEALIKGFERFLPEGASEGEIEEVEVVVVRDEEEGRQVVGSSAGRIEDVTETEGVVAK